MRVVVTGGAGFLGSHLCGQLLKRGDDVVCIDNFATGGESNLAHLRQRQLLSGQRLSVVEQDVSAYLDINGAVDAVLHFASPASPVDYAQLPIQTLKAGSLGTHNTLGLAKSKGAKYLLASTSEVYGDPLVHPQDEQYWGNVNPIGPRGVYDEAKRFAEAMTMAYRRHHGLDTGIVRIFNTYGPRMRVDDGRVVSNFIAAALANEPISIYGDGSQTRSFCFIDDQIRGIVALLDSDEHDPVNIGSPHEVTVTELAELVLDVTGSSSQIKHLPLPTDDPQRRCPDISRASELLGWMPTVPLREGLAKTAEYFGSLLPAP